MYLKTKNHEIIIRKSDSKLLCKKIIIAFFLSVVFYLVLLTSALAQETYIVTTFYGNIEAKDDSLAIINSGESVTLRPVIPNDTFDGTAVDTKKWEQLTWNGATISQDDRLIISTSGEIETSIAEVRTEYEFIGDFDVQVDFEIDQGYWSNPHQSHLDGAVMGIRVGSSQCHLTNIKQSNGDQQIWLYSFQEGEGVLAAINTTANVGRYKIIRIGSLFRFWYDIGSGWKELGSISISSMPVEVYLDAGSQGVKHAFTTYFDNFKINSGATNYRSEASMRMVAHGFANMRLLDSLKVGAALPVGSMLAVKLYGKENLFPNWKLLGEYQFDHDTKNVAISIPAYVDSVRYGLTGSEGIRFIATNTDSLPILHSITLNTRLEESPPEVTVIQPTPNSAEKWDIYELILINRDTYANPFWDVTVTGKFTGPNSQVIVIEGFYYDKNTWKIRFSPVQEGTWTYAIRFTTSTSTITKTGSLNCTPAGINNLGFIGIDNSNRYKFVYSDGTIFIPVGIATGLPVGISNMLGFAPGPNQVPEMWDYISSKHINTLDIDFYHQPQFELVFPWNPTEGTANLLSNSGGLDKYNLTNAKLIDKWFEAAKVHGINLFVCFFNVFDIPGIPFNSSFWSVDKGGPYNKLEDMFSSDNFLGMELEKKYCKYMLSRWAAYRNIVAWEYNGELGIACTDNWLTEIDKLIDESDPYRRPHTVAFWSLDWCKESKTNFSSTIDITFNNSHPVAGRKLERLNLYNELTVDSLIQDEVFFCLMNYEKLTMFSEFGMDSESWNKNLIDSHHNYDRISNWASFSAGSYSLFWLAGPNEPIGNQYNRTTVDYLDHFHKIISRIRDLLSMYSHNQLVLVSDPLNMRAYCLTNNTEFLIYVHHFSNHSTTMQSKSLYITLPVTQFFQTSWFDPSTGQLVSTDEGATGDGEVSMTIPDFIVDIVLYIRTSSNFPPVLTEIPDVSFLEDDTLAFDLVKWYSYVDDPDDPDSTLNWAVQGGKNVFAFADQGMVNFFARQNWFGIDTLSVMVSDEEFSDTTSLIIHVQPINDAPMIVPLPDTTMSYNDTLSINLNEFVTDVDDADTSLTWSAVSSNDSLFVTIDQNNRAHFTALMFEGEVAVELTARDDSLAADRDTLFVTVTAPTSVSGDLISQLPTEFLLSQNYPNPFNIETAIKYDLPKPCRVSLKIYNCLGEEVATLVESFQAAGRYKVVWYADRFPSGVYFARLRAGVEHKKVQKLLMLK